jgi:hypothetical protein
VRAICCRHWTQIRAGCALNLIHPSKLEICGKLEIAVISNNISSIKHQIHQTSQPFNETSKERGDNKGQVNK